MALSINTNAGAMTALQNLNRTNRSLEVTQLRITTGLKVNGPKDDAATFSIAQRMRGDLAGMRAVQTALSGGVATVDVAIEATKSISDLLLEMKAKVVQANQAGLDAASRTALTNDFNALRDQIDTIANTAEFNGVNLVKSNLQVISTTSGVAVGAASGWVNTGIAVSAGDVVEFAASGTVNFAFGAGNTATPDGSFEGATRYDTTLVTGESVHSLVGRVGSTALADTSGFAVGSAATEISGGAGNLILGFNDTGVLADRSGYNGGNLADNSGSFSVDVTVSRPDDYKVLSTPKGDTIAVKGHYLTAASLGLDKVDLSTAGSARNGLTEIDRAIETVSNALASLGSSAKRIELQADFTVSLMDILKQGIGNLVDADLAQEAASLQAEQTRQQLGVQALSIANSAPQTILSLFNG